MFGRIPGEEPSLGGKLAVTTCGVEGGVGDVANSDGMKRSVEVTVSNWSGVVENVPEDDDGDAVVESEDLGVKRSVEISGVVGPEVGGVESEGVNLSVDKVGNSDGTDAVEYSDSGVVVEEDSVVV